MFGQSVRRFRSPPIGLDDFCRRAFRGRMLNVVDIHGIADADGIFVGPRTSFVLEIFLIKSDAGKIGAKLLRLRFDLLRHRQRIGDIDRFAEDRARRIAAFPPGFHILRKHRPRFRHVENSIHCRPIDRLTSCPPTRIVKDLMGPNFLGDPKSVYVITGPGLLFEYKGIIGKRRLDFKLHFPIPTISSRMKGWPVLSAFLQALRMRPPKTNHR